MGQLVACAGNEHALHAEVNWVPVNLCVPVADDVPPQHAAFATVGAIAMHGVRRAEVQLGETACVIGLGLVGQLAVQLLLASGVRVVGFDVVDDRCRTAEAAGATACARPDHEGIEHVESVVRGPHARRRRRPHLHRGGRRVERSGAHRGPDRARPGTRRRHREDESRSPVERVLRQGARRPLLALVRARVATTTATSSRASTTRRATCAGRNGAISRASSTSWNAVRSRSSCSSPGPSRSTTRPTSTRASPTTRCPASASCSSTPRSPAATQPVDSVPQPAVPPRERVTLGPVNRPLRVGFVGAGNYATSMLLPHLQRDARVELTRVATSKSLSAVNAQRKFGFRHAATGEESVLDDEDIDAVFIATRHHSHAELVCRGTGAGKGGVRREAAGAVDRRARTSAGHRRADGQRPADGRVQSSFRPVVRRDEGALRRFGFARVGALRRQRRTARPVELVPQRRLRGLAVCRRGWSLHRHVELVVRRPARRGVRRRRGQRR